MRVLARAAVAFAGLMAGFVTGVGAAGAQGLEQSHISVGAGGSPFYYLPLLIGDQLGYFKAEGLTLSIADFGGGAKALEALVGGSADIVPGAYEHTIRMQAKGQDIRAVIELGRLPGIALAIGKARAASYKSLEDLKGMKIGVTAPGSSTHFLVMYMLSKAGIDPASASYIAVGASSSAVASIKSGAIDAISNLDPVLTRLQLDGDVKIIADTRTVEGTRAIFGGTNPACVLLITQRYIERNPKTVQALVNGFYKTLQWMDKASAEEIVAKVPEKFLIGDRAFTTAALTNNKQVYSATGVVPVEGMKSVYDMLAAFDAEMKNGKIDLAKTFDGSFVRRASGGN
ncbi:MAG: ABC transporter substrate-binding protein [Pseudomonadota bacterium]